jgi:hypothetical protein
LFPQGFFPAAFKTNWEKLLAAGNVKQDIAGE